MRLFVRTGHLFVLAFATAPALVPAHAQLSPQNIGTLQAALQRSDLSALLLAADAVCGTTLKYSRDADTSVARRADLAREALKCAQAVTAFGFAEAADATKSLQYREVLSTWQLEYAENKVQKESEESFLGLRWGVGLGFSLGADGNIDGADIVGGTVRVSSDLKHQPRLLLEYHKFFWCNGGKHEIGTHGCGPFVAAAATDDRILSGVGIGLMYGRKANATDPDGFSFGVGALLDAKVKDLGRGFVADQPPPAGEISIRFLTRSRWSTLLFVTRTF